jgi:hypothetical protein
VDTSKKVEARQTKNTMAVVAELEEMGLSQSGTVVAELEEMGLS